MKLIGRVVFAIIIVIILNTSVLLTIFAIDSYQGEVGGKSDAIQSILDGWCEEYGISQPVIFVGYKDMDDGFGSILGLCCHYDGGFSTIMLGGRFEDRPLGWLEKSILWHEFCHANAYLEDMVSNGHDIHFYEYLCRKPNYVLGDYYACLLYEFM